MPLATPSPKVRAKRRISRAKSKTPPNRSKTLPVISKIKPKALLTASANKYYSTETREGVQPPGFLSAQIGWEIDPRLSPATHNQKEQHGRYQRTCSHWQ